MSEAIKQRTKVLVMNRATNYALGFLIIAAAISYIYFANIAVRTLTVLEKTKVQVQSLSVEVSEMETKRLLAQNAISQSLAQQMGFVEVNNPTFIMKGGSKATLSFKTN